MFRKLQVFEFARGFTGAIFGPKRQSLKVCNVPANRLMSEEPACKRPCMMKIGTHNGTFHCDEVLACFMLKQLPQYKDAEIVRTRDAAVLDTCDIVVDVGGVFDPAKNRFDHHQRQSLKVCNVPANRLMSEEPACKRPCMMKIGTHNGTFHCDEVLACFMLKQLPQYKDAEIVRTRDAAVLDTCDIVVDVGGVFDPAKNRFDHHQRTFSENMKSLLPDKTRETKLSSAGLVYVHFGGELLAQILELPRDDPVTNIIYDKVYDNFVEEIDAIDNGIDQTDGVQKYRITTTLSSRVGNLNPHWNQTDVDIDAQFRKAMEMVGAEFMDRVLYFKQAWLPARDLVQTAIKQRKEVDESGEIICMKEGGAPWKDHLFSLEAELGVSPPIKYILYTDQNGAWRIQCVPIRVGSFENRLSILEEWRGVRDEELTKKSGIPGCIFVHAGGFIGGNKTYDGVLEMARRCLKQPSS